MSRPSWVPRALVAVITALSCVLLVASCAELDARRTIQKADKLCHEGRYDEAVVLYKKALAEYDLTTGHHNLAIAAYTAYQPGIKTKANAGYAKTAAEHFQDYLKVHPDDKKIIELLTTVWINSDKLDVALAFWEKRREQDSADTEPLRKISEIYRLKKNFPKALEVDYARVTLASTPEAKVRILVQIGSLQYRRLTKQSLVDYERVQVADSGIAALQEALRLEPDNSRVHGLLATIFQFRSLASQAGWARGLDIASQRFHLLRLKEMTAAKKAKRAEHAKSASGGAAAGSANKSTGGNTNTGKAKPASGQE